MSHGAEGPLVAARPPVIRPRCGACGDAGSESRPLRRGRCASCYEDWVKARPVGIGATCSGCGDRRRLHLRHYEIESKERVAGGRWIVLCHNCTAIAQAMKPAPRSIEGLKMRLQRDRRWGDRRAASVGGKSERDTGRERRDGDRRLGLRDLYDATEIAEELIIEMEADYEDLDEQRVIAAEDMTGVHYRPSLEEITKITFLPSLMEPPAGAPKDLESPAVELELAVEPSAEVAVAVAAETAGTAGAAGTIEEALADAVAQLEEQQYEDFADLAHLADPVASAPAEAASDVDASDDDEANVTGQVPRIAASNL